MGRTVDVLSGLAIQGRLSVAGVSLPVPCVAWSTSRPDEKDGPEGFPLTLHPGDVSTIGERTVVWETSDGRLPIRFPVPVPEVSGAAGSAHRTESNVWVLHWPLSTGDWELVRSTRPELVVLGNARALFREGEPFVQAVRDIRDRLGGGPGLWAPRVALPNRLALLTYLGIDVADTTEARLRVAGGASFESTLGERIGDDVKPEGQPGRLPPEVGAVEVAREFRTELDLVRRSTRDGRLRELVEARLTSEPALAEILRYADRILKTLLEERTPVVGKGIRGYVLRESQRRPEVTRFLDRFLARYRPPPSKELLVLLPCSKTKPYRSSPSHRRYSSALDGLPNPHRVHIASVTSPLGLVPRELEDVFPARHYDIPVTGEWDEEERRRVVLATEHMVQTGHYSGVIVHLDPEEYEFLRSSAALRDLEWTASDEHTTSASALDSLRSALERRLRDSRPVPGGPLAVVREELHEVAAYQFGRDAADRLFADPVRLMGRPWFQRLADGARQDLATWREERGLFQLTVAGARRMFPAHPLEVEVAADVQLTGDLFTPGIVRADPLIARGDAVTLARRGELLAVGEAELPGRLMTELPRGLAVRVRHRVHGSVPEPPTAT